MMMMMMMMMKRPDFRICSQLPLIPGADPGFFLGGGEPLRNDVTDR